MTEIMIRHELLYNISGYIPPAADANNQRFTTQQGCSKTFIVLTSPMRVYKTTQAHSVAYT